jgi:hypothetical protein
MTPLEIAAKARWESRAEDNFPHRWEDFTGEGRKEHMQDMRAALLALADSACPREELLPHGYTPRHWAMLRAVLRVVAA